MKFLPVVAAFLLFFAFDTAAHESAGREALPLPATTDAGNM